MLTARIAKPGHKFDGKAVIITHLGINGHPFIDSAYGYCCSRHEGRPVAVIILGIGHATELLDTIRMDELVITQE